MAHNRRQFLRSAAAGAAMATLPAGALPAPKPDSHAKPNIVFILADDLGYGDVQCLNPASSIPTPNINKLAESGMKFTDAHSPSAVCTPTRYGVLTGRYCWRTRLKSGVLNGYSPPLIDTQRPTVASMLRGAGYTTGMVGKWHLGLGWGRDPAGKIDFRKPITVSPNQYGFDYSHAIPASLDFPPYVYIHNGRLVEPPTARSERQGFPGYLRAGERGPGFQHIQSLDHLLGEAKAYVARQAKAAKPFFLYVALTSPHKPVLPAKRFVGKTKLGPYGDFLVQTDWTVGQVVEAVEAAGIRENTLIVLTSDNGSFMFQLPEGTVDHVGDPTVQGYCASHHRSNHVLRGTKADIYEGGHRIPFVASWPGRIKPGGVCGETICLTDFFATAAAVAGAPLPDSAAEDSFSALPLLLGKGRDRPRAPVIHHSANGTFAIREGKWKLILSTGSGGREKPAGRPGSKPYRLFNLADDLSEKTDLASAHPEIVARMARAMEAIKESGRSR